MQPFLEVFDAQRLQKSGHRILRRRIARTTGQTMQTGHRRHADDRTFRRLKIGQRIFAAVDRTPEVDVHQTMQHFEVYLVEKRPHRKPGVADQHVDAAELAYGRVDQPAALLGLGHVDPAISRLPTLGADFSSKKLQLIHTAGTHNHPRAARCELARQSLADTRRSTGHNDRLILEIFHIHLLSCCFSCPGAPKPSASSARFTKSLRAFLSASRHKPCAPPRAASVQPRHATRFRGTYA